MRVESSVLSVSWIPSALLDGLRGIPFERGPLHYDEPPPEHLHDLDALQAADRFRFANELTAWLEVDGGRIRDFGQGGRGLMGVTRMRLRAHEVTFAAVGFPEIRPEPEVAEDRVRFIQTFGGRAGFPSPRPVRRPPFVQWAAPAVWTTLALTLHVDGRAERELLGASTMPRHWVYDDRGRVVAKSSVVDLDTWALDAFGAHTPWGDQDSPAMVSAVETAVERELSTAIMQEGRPELRTLEAGATLVREGQPGRELYLILDGVLTVAVGGEPIAEVGPGAVIGERALLEGGTRTATVRAATRCRVAVADDSRIDRQALTALTGYHRREEQRPAD